MKKNNRWIKVLIPCIAVVLIVTVLLLVWNEREGKETVINMDAVAEGKASGYISGTRYYDPIAKDTDVIQDVVYGSNGGTELKMDVYMAKDDTQTNRPVIILFHGGGLTSGDKSTDTFIKSVAMEYAELGYVTFDVNYRIADTYSIGALKNAVQDAATAFNYIQEQSETYGINPQCITLAGYSSGAQIAQNLCYSNDDSYGIDRGSILSVVAFAGGPLQIGAAKEGNPPCLIFHGTKDTTISYSYSEDFAKMLQDKNIETVLYPLEGLNHILTSRYDEICNQTTMFLYYQMTGVQVTVNHQSDISPEYDKVVERMENAVTYQAKQIDLTLDGNLDEWGDSEKIELNQLKDAGTTLPDPSDFSGTVMVGWNAQYPTMVYLAATVIDDQIGDSNEASGKWYNDDCLEIAFDLSENNITEQITKWIVGENAKDFSILATEENTQAIVVQNGSTYTYEIAIDLSKIDADVLQSEVGFSAIVGKTIGFSISYNDSDNGTREHQIGWIAGKSSDMANFGNLYFSQENAK